MRDPLAIVLRLRRVTVDDARRHLATTLRAAERSNQDAALAEAAIGAEGEAAADLLGDDSAVEAFAAWLPIGRAKAAATKVAAERAGSEVAKARAAVSLARAAAEAADNLLARRRAAIAAVALRKAQADTDEIAGRIKAPEDR